MLDSALELVVRNYVVAATPAPIPLGKASQRRAGLLDQILALMAEAMDAYNTCARWHWRNHG